VRKAALIGEKFERLTVISYAGRYIGYNCVCDCGNKTIARGDALKKGKHKSCGCLMKEMMGKRALPDFQAFKNDLYDNYKKAAIRRGHEFSLTKEEFVALIVSNCFYCGIKFSLRYYGNKRKHNSNDFCYNGVDRRDNKRGYTVENCVSCCKICNNSKSTLTEQEWFDWVKRIYKFQKL